MWFSGTLHLDPIVWKFRFPTSISSQVVSDDNPKGRLTNSDLELAGVLLHYCVLESVVGSENMKHTRAGIFCDNTPAVYWTKRMADRSQSLTSGRLLRGLAMRQRTNRSGPTTVAHEAGETNKMADVASRVFNTEFADYDDSQFKNYFQSLFPLPQMLSWTVVPTPPDMALAVTSTLLGKRLTVLHWTRRTETEIGPTGPIMPQPNAAVTPSSAAYQKTSNRTCSSVSLLGCGKVTTDGRNKSWLAPWKRRSATYLKPSCWLTAPIPDESTPMESANNSTTPSDGCFDPTASKTQSPNGNLPSPSPR